MYSTAVMIPPASHPYFGLFLSILSSLLVGGSFIFQKLGLLRTQKEKRYGDGKANSSGFAYLYEWMWWSGMLSMAVGEVLNFVAYSMAPAILIALLGALRVVVTAILADIFLKERLNIFGKIGVLLSLIGSTVIVIHSPKHEMVTTFDQVVSHFTDPAFLLYTIILTIATIVLIAWAGPKYGNTNVHVFISVCNIVGALAVLLGKGLAITLKELLIDPGKVLMHPLFWVLILGNVVGILIQIVYLNKSLAVFSTQIITPIKYVVTNVFLVFGSILLFQEFAFMMLIDILGMTCGFITIVTGVVLLNSFKADNEKL